jgi:hypothetical protein
MMSAEAVAAAYHLDARQLREAAPTGLHRDPMVVRIHGRIAKTLGNQMKKLIALLPLLLSAPTIFAAGIPADDLGEILVTAQRHGLIGKVESGARSMVLLPSVSPYNTPVDGSAARASGTSAGIS